MQKIFGDLSQLLGQPGHLDKQQKWANEAKLVSSESSSIVADG